MPQVRRLVALAAALAPALAGATAHAQAPGQTLDTTAVGAPQLGVAAGGAALVAWTGEHEVRSAGGRRTFVRAILATSRSPSGELGRVRLLSDPRRDAAPGFALAVGRAGDAAVVLRGSAAGALLVARRASASSRLGAPVAIPGSARGRQPAAALGPDGTLAVAWLAPGRRGCGSVVLAAVASRGRPFGAAGRVSGACPSAATPRVALGAGGDGAVAWRAGRTLGYARNRFSIGVAPLVHGRPRAAATASRGPAVAGSLDLAADGDGVATVLWRDQASVSRAGARGRVLAATVGARGPSAPFAVSASDRVVGPARLAALPGGAAFAVWEEGPSPAPAVVVARRAAGEARFAAPETVDPCGAVDASRTGAVPALSAGGAQAVAFQTACPQRLGLGTDFSVALLRSPASQAPFGAPSALSDGSYARNVQLGLGDDGAGVAVWLQRGGLQVAGVR
jgi:hypothetical protein